MQFNAVHLNSTPDVLVEEIISQIKTNRLNPGDRLPPQRELAKMFNVGLGSVREAVKMLDVMGCIHVIRGKGTFISKSAIHKIENVPIEKTLEAMSVADLIAAREIVECGAARMAAKNADKESIHLLKKLAKEMNASSDDTDIFYKLDFQFHIAVAEASNNKAICEIVKLLVNRAHGHINFMSESLSIALPFTVEKAVSTARSVMSSIEAGDANGAEQHMREHINIVNTNLYKEFLSKNK